MSIDLNLVPVDNDVRNRGLDDEVSFWKDFVTSDRFRINWCQTVPNPELELEIDVFVKLLACEIHKSGGRARILDVGSGPVSILTNSFIDIPADLVAADPLAHDYDKLWQAPYKDKVCRPVTCPGEKLVRHFGPRAFDLVHIRNALDHSVNPLLVFQEMIFVTKPGGYIIVHGFGNEATMANWGGFHQWNIAHQEGDLVISGKDGASNSLLGPFERLIKPIRSFQRKDIHGRDWCGIITQVE